MVDRYPDQIKDSQNLNNQIKQAFEDRKATSAKGQSTGRLDYSLRSQLDRFKVEITGLEKLLYLYENNNANIPSNVTDKMKKSRISELNKFLPAAKQLQQDV